MVIRTLHLTKYLPLIATVGYSAAPRESRRADTSKSVGAHRRISPIPPEYTERGTLTPRTQRRTVQRARAPGKTASDVIPRANWPHQACSRRRPAKNAESACGARRRSAASRARIDHVQAPIRTWGQQHAPAATFVNAGDGSRSVSRSLEG